MPLSKNESKNDHLIVYGGKKLTGEVAVQGDKVVAVHLLFAALVLNEKSIIRNLPFCGDVLTILEWAISNGVASVNFHTDFTAIEPCAGNHQDISQIANIRGSICLAAPIALKYGQVFFSDEIKGCNFTNRPINKHTELLEALGITLISNGDIVSGVKMKQHNCVHFDCSTQYGPSVGVTVHALIASIFFEGELHLHNVALEPAVVLLIKLVRRYKPVVVRERNISICNKATAENNPDYLLIPDDYTAAFTYVSACMLTRGHCFIKMQSIFPLFLLQILENMNIIIAQEETGISVNAQNVRSPGSLVCDVWPALPSDTGPVIAAGLCKCAGETKITDRVYDKRSAHIKGLNSMGYFLKNIGNEIFVTGQLPHLECIAVEATDIRSGAALLIGAAGRKAETVITNAAEIFRGYEDLPGDLAAMDLGISCANHPNDIRLARLKVLAPV